MTPETADMNFDEFLDFLEAKADRPDPDHPGQTIPGHGPALCMSSDDWNTMKTELEQACRQMGSHCSYAMKNAIRRFNTQFYTSTLLRK